MDFTRQPYYYITHNYIKNNVEFQYPSFYTSNSNSDSKILNKLVRKSVYDFVNQMPDDDKIKLIGNYEIKTNARDIVSITLYTEYQIGENQPAKYVKSINFNTKTQLNMSLSEHFKNDDSYILAISRHINDEIDRRKIILLEPKFTRIEPNERYYIADKSIVIFFEIYDIAPYSEGIPFFVIPLNKVKQHLKSESPLNKLIASI